MNARCNYVAYNETSGLIVELFGVCSSIQEMQKKIDNARMPSYIKAKKTE